MSGAPLWPPAISQYAREADWIVFGFTALLMILVVPIFAALVWFAIKYRRGSAADRTHKISRSVAIEAAWSAIPFALSLVFFVWAASLFYRLYHPPEGALVIDVVAKQWMWKFQHPGGQREIDELHVPMGEPVELTMISQDVIHSLFLPALRIKQDVLPGRYTSLWFNADRPGEYLLECAEFCGTEHSHMGGRLIVLAPAEYQRWLDRTGTDETWRRAASDCSAAMVAAVVTAPTPPCAPPRSPASSAARCRCRTGARRSPTRATSATTS
jgi:cytochrome c oxidase subunit II